MYCRHTLAKTQWATVFCKFSGRRAGAGRSQSAALPLFAPPPKGLPPLLWRGGPLASSLARSEAPQWRPHTSSEQRAESGPKSVHTKHWAQWFAAPPAGQWGTFQLANCWNSLNELKWRAKTNTHTVRSVWPSCKCVQLKVASCKSPVASCQLQVSS